MVTIRVLCLVVALSLFLIDAFWSGGSSRVRLTPLGLAFGVLSVLVPFVR